MSTDHRGGNLQNEIIREEHDGTNNAKRVNVVAGGVGQATVTLDEGTSNIGFATVTSTNPGTLSGNVTLNPGPNYIGIVTVANPSSFTGNVTLDEGSKTQIVGNLTLSDPKGFIGLVTAVSETSFTGNVTLDPGSQTGIVGNVTIDSGTVDVSSVKGNLTIDSVAGVVNVDATGQGDVPVTLGGEKVGISGNVTLSDSKTYIGLTTSTIANTVNTNFSGNITLDEGSLTGIVGNVTVDQVDVVTAVTDITNPVAIKGNLTLSDSKGFIGLVTAVSETSFSGNVTLDDGSKTGIVGNVTIDSGTVSVDSNTAWSDPNTYIGLVTVGNTVNTSFSGNITLDSGSLTGIVGNLTLSDPKGFIGLVTAVSETSFTGNVTLDPGSQTGIVGNLTIDSQPAWSDPNTYIGLTTAYIANPVGNATLNPSPNFIGIVTVANPSSFTGNVTLDDGSLTGIVGNVTIDSIASTVNTAVIGNVTVDQVDVVTAVTDITNPVGIKGNLTLSDPKGFIGLVTAVSQTSFEGNVTLDAGSLTGIVGNLTIDSGTVTLGTGEAWAGLMTVWNANGAAGTEYTEADTDASITGRAIMWEDTSDTLRAVSAAKPLPVDAAFSGNVTLDAGSLTGITGNITVDQVDVVTAVTDITNPVGIKGNLTLSDPKGFIGLVTAVSETSFTGNVTLDPGSQTQIIGNVTVDQVDVVTAVTDITNPVALKGNLTIDSGNVSVVGNVTVDQVDTVTTVTAVTDITNPVALKGNLTLSDPKGFIGLVTAVSETSFSGNVTLDPGSQTGVVGNLTIDSIASNVNVVNIGNITLDDGSKTQVVGNLTIDSQPAWTDPKTFIGLVTAVSETSFSGNVTLDPGSQTQVIGNITIDSGTVTLGANDGVDIGDVDVASNTAWADPNTYIGLVTVDIGTNNTVDASFSGNVTLDSGSLTGIVGNVTVDQVDVVTAVTDITNPVALKGNLTIDSVASNVNVVNIGNITLDDGSQVGVVGNVTLSDAKTYIGLVTTTQAPIAPATTVQKIISSTGQTAISSAVASNYFYVKDLVVGSLGDAEVQFEEGSTVMIPYISLATKSGYVVNFGESGMRAGTANTAFNARLNGAATVSIMANMYWHTT